MNQPIRSSCISSMANYMECDQLIKSNQRECKVCCSYSGRTFSSHFSFLLNSEHNIYLEDGPAQVPFGLPCGRKAVWAREGWAHGQTSLGRGWDLTSALRLDPTGGLTWTARVCTSDFADPSRHIGTAAA